MIFDEDGTLTKDAKNELLQDAFDAVDIASRAVPGRSDGVERAAIIGPVAAALLRRIGQARSRPYPSPKDSD